MDDEKSLSLASHARALQTIGVYKVNLSNIPKYSNTRKIAVISPKFEKCGFTVE